jgi:glycosyltransferase involved in cell wall biosynthesis
VHIVVLNWRDTANPEGGGSEVYVENIARRLVERGHAVTIVCAEHDHAPSLEFRDGVRFVRTGSKLTVYSRARRLLRSGALGTVDVVVDTQNGIPFFARWATSAPVVVLVHHVHREQWPVVYDAARARIGWYIESRVAPRVYRGSRYIAVSHSTKRELISLGVSASAISVVHNGTNAATDTVTPRDSKPRVLVLGRLVPHKRVEHVLAAAATLRRHQPELTVAVVGDGWWAPELATAARAWGVDDIVEFTGHVDETDKARQIARAWVLALPSLKEGWGLVVLEAASAGVPTVAYAEAGGVAESVRDGETGILVSGDEAAFTAALSSLIDDDALRNRMGLAAQRHAAAYSWEASTDGFEEVLRAAVGHDAAPVRARVSPRASWWSRKRRTAHQR